MPRSSINAVFAHGVASGDPDESSVVIWTRVSEATGPVTVDWRISSDADFLDVVAHGQHRTDSSRDHTVKVVVGDLAPGQKYFYEFAANGATSAQGQTRTLPVGHVEKLVLAVATCSNFPFGYFNAYEVIADDPDIDLVVHLGDYIYEYAEDGYGGETGKRIGRIHEPRHEIITLDDYRQRHAQYKSDQGSLAMHARHPLIVIWDDHESANNPWMGGAENHQAEEGEWMNRRAASLQAYYEWMPIRDPANNRSPQEFWRHYKFGDLASLITLESRHTGRDLQISYSDHIDDLDTPEDVQEFLSSVLGNPSRNMLSTKMEAFLRTELDESVRAGRRWRIIGNQSVMAKSIFPKLDEPLFDKLRNELDDAAKDTLKNLTRLGELDLPGDLDSWEGYPAARERFYQIAKDAGARDLLVLAGDSHSYWANALYDDNDQSMGLELGSTGISSPRSLLALGEDGLKRFDELMAEHNKEIVWTDGRHRGYIRLQIDHDGGRADFVTVSEVESRHYSTRTVKSLKISNSNGGLSFG